NMLWCLSGNIALTHKVLFGIDFEKDGLAFHPFVPQALAGTRSLNGFRYRDAMLDITVSGYGDKIKSFKVNGKDQMPFIPAKNAKGNMKIDIVMADNTIPEIGINHKGHSNAPLTPIVWLEGNTLMWNPIEYIGHYIVLKDGKQVAKTNATTYDASQPGEYQVIGVSTDGVESFASEPRSTRKQIYVEAGKVSNDKTSTLNIPVNVSEEGDYFITVNYANGNGPVNTENKCAIRTLTVDGDKEGLIVMPQRGRDNWDDYGWSNSVKVRLTPGNHTVGLDFRPENKNMNIHTNHAVITGIKLVKD
ncbi:MAG: hypothetical protein K2J78_08500, partial [Muribaculaceae bacterium]|nr:hypothetical protein [Muribaculaceae bacterium]